jgi:hypothetical protein
VGNRITSPVSAGSDKYLLALLVRTNCYREAQANAVNWKAPWRPKGKRKANGKAFNLYAITFFF